jgi:hypothetical protein
VAALAARPVLGRLLPDRDVVARPGGEVSGLAQQQLFGAVLGLLAELAEGHPVLLILEDLHWADRSTRDLITFLSRVLHRERVAVVATYRTDDLHRRHPLRPVVAELLRLPSVASIELGPLGYADMADHLTALAGRPLDPAALHRMVARAEGNPYYAEELLASLAPVRSGGVAGALGGGLGGDVLPSGLAALLLARVEQLPSAAQQVLRAAAVGGRRVDDDIVRAASGLAGPSTRTRSGTGGPAVAGAGRRGLPHVPARPDPRGALHRPAPRRADQAARPVRRAVGRPRPPGPPYPVRRRTGPSPPGQPRHRGSLRRVGPGFSQESERLAAPAEAHRHYDAALALWERVSEPEVNAGQDQGHLASAPRTVPRPAARSPGRAAAAPHPRLPA